MENPIDEQFLLLTIEQLRLKYPEPAEIIPSYTEKEIDELFNCIERVYGGYLQTPQERIAAAIFNITKGHYLSNGNKRVAVIVTSILYGEEIQSSVALSSELLEKLVLGIADGSIDREKLLVEIYKLSF